MDQNYSTLKNQTIIAPPSTIDLGTTSNRYGNLFLSGNIDLSGTIAGASTLNIPKVASISFPTGATAADPAGGETVTITGSGFASGLHVYIANVAVASSTLTGSTLVTFTTPAKTAGNYPLSVVNSDGGIAAYVPGITYDPMPVWSTSAGSLGNSNQLATITPITLSASENAQAITYTVTSGSLPSGLSLSSSGVISGTPSAVSGSTTFNFTITATDPQGQQSSRNFSYTVNKVCTVATGGTITTVGNYKIHTFTTSGTFTITQTGTPIDILIVAGGGSGGYYYDSGGGGAGAALYASNYDYGSTYTYTVTVGGGGAGAGSRTNGGDSSFGTATAKGGGAGGSPDGGLPGNAGGCGGGGAGLNGNTAGVNGGASNQGAVSGYTKYGNAGGTGSMVNGVPYGAGGGGGGCGAAGTAASGGGSGSGGIGIVNPIAESTTGQLVSTSYYVGGGGGGGSDYTGSAGGSGGGGHGQGAGSTPSTAGTANTGGGGGGSSRFVQYSNSSGGSGVVIVRYQFQ